MSDRDRQNKHDRDNNISSSMYSRVNVGNNLNNSKNGTRHTEIAGSMNNPDEKLENLKIPVQVLVHFFTLYYFSVRCWF
ncbi:hypothetical protein [Marinilactibacillus sp. Marseille-P9653]|uniref:hypothetical protein n=1 Tax=Marinilactibacillus sp. Marseille-P9653 TaxID=2866583 RepID=UPI001CE3BD52|nr:hypothetical protein [Marinilactibacillus sp. Marseille-P9653]